MLSVFYSQRIRILSLLSLCIWRLIKQLVDLNKSTLHFYCFEYVVAAVDREMVFGELIHRLADDAATHKECPSNVWSSVFLVQNLSIYCVNAFSSNDLRWSLQPNQRTGYMFCCICIFGKWIFWFVPFQGMPHWCKHQVKVITFFRLSAQ